MHQVLSFFPKFLRGAEPKELARVVADAGLDTVDAVIRPGYWTPPDTLGDTLPGYVRTMADHRMTVSFAVTGFEPAMLAADPEPLAVMADCGITDFRLGWFERDGRPPRELLAEARSDLEVLSPHLEHYRLRAVVQLHFGTLIASPSAAWNLVYGLDPAHIGVQLDPGNQALEGYEEWNYACGLLDEYIASVSVKDVRPRLCSHGRRLVAEYDWVPLSEGSLDWVAIAIALKSIDFSGTLELMPFYHPNDPAAHVRALAEDVRTLHRYFNEGEDAYPEGGGRASGGASGGGVVA